MLYALHDKVRRAVFNAPDRGSVLTLLEAAVKKYEQAAPKLARWIDENLSQGVTVFCLPPAHRRLLRTGNSLERVNKQVQRRTRVATIFSSQSSCLRLGSAVLMEMSQEWMTGKAYAIFQDQNPWTILNIKSKEYAETIYWRNVAISKLAVVN